MIYVLLFQSGVDTRATLESIYNVISIGARILGRYPGAWAYCALGAGRIAVWKGLSDEWWSIHLSVRKVKSFSDIDGNSVRQQDLSSTAIKVF